MRPLSRANSGALNTPMLLAASVSFLIAPRADLPQPLVILPRVRGQSPRALRVVARFDVGVQQETNDAEHDHGDDDAEGFKHLQPPSRFDTADSSATPLR